MDINNFNDYLIYKDGRVYSKKRNIFKKPIITRGYYRIGLYNDKKESKFLIHRLVADHYIPNPNQYPFVDHIDRNPLNNNMENLRWCNHKENCNNRGLRSIGISNSSGHLNITLINNNWKFMKSYKHKIYQKYCKSLTDALCYKYIFLLKIKSNII